MTVSVLSGHIGTSASVQSADASSRGLSASLWRNSSIYLANDPSRGIYVFEDFKNMTVNGGTVSQFFGDAGVYAALLDSGATVAQVSGDFGICRMATDTTNEDECNLVFGSPTCVLGRISDTAGQKSTTIFETRIRTNSIVDGVAGLKIGLLDAGQGEAADELTDTSADLEAARDFIGFSADEDDGDQLDTMHQVTSGTNTTPGTDVVSGGLVADTWIKLGFAYFPDHSDGGRVVFSVDGTILADVVTTPFAATFPNGVYLRPVWSIRNDAGGAAKQLDIDWWSFYQSGELS